VVNRKEKSLFPVIKYRVCTMVFVDGSRGFSPCVRSQLAQCSHVSYKTDGMTESGRVWTAYNYKLCGKGGCSTPVFKGFQSAGFQESAVRFRSGCVWRVFTWSATPPPHEKFQPSVPSRPPYFSINCSQSENPFLGHPSRYNMAFIAGEYPRFVRLFAATGGPGGFA
jgi:hypothetical protein